MIWLFMKYPFCLRPTRLFGHQRIEGPFLPMTWSEPWDPQRGRKEEGLQHWPLSSIFHLYQRQGCQRPNNLSSQLRNKSSYVSISLRCVITIFRWLSPLSWQKIYVTTCHWGYLLQPIFLGEKYGPQDSGRYPNPSLSVWKALTTHGATNFSSGALSIIQQKIKKDLHKLFHFFPLPSKQEETKSIFQTSSVPS